MPRGLRNREGYYGYEDYDVYGRRCDPLDSKWVNPDQTDEKGTHPYSYSEFFIFGGHRAIKQEGVQGVYSDRVFQWWCQEGKSSKGFDDLWKEFVGTRYALASAEKLSEFFTAYNQILWPKNHKDKKAKVVALAEGCNPSSGYPYWIIWYKETE